MPEKNSRNFAWPISITVVYAIFMLFLFTFLAFTQSVGVDLVTDDYYEQEIKYQQQIDRLERTKALPVQPKVYLSDNRRELVVQFDRSLSPVQVLGQITLFRPSNEALDFKIPLRFDAGGKLTIAANKLHKGLWKAKIEWRMDGLEYYFEEVVIVP